MVPKSSALPAWARQGGIRITRVVTNLMSSTHDSVAHMRHVLRRVGMSANTARKSASATGGLMVAVGLEEISAAGREDERVELAGLGLVGPPGDNHHGPGNAVVQPLVDRSE